MAFTNSLLLSTDTLSWYGLDLIFQIAKKLWYDGIDLAMRKNFDSRNVKYVTKLSQEHELPISIIQVSADVSMKELNQAIQLADALDCKVITLNSPRIFNFKSFSFIEKNIWLYRKQNPTIQFAIINPPKDNLFVLPIPKFRFSSIVDIIKTYHCHVGLDIVHLDETTLENDFMRKMPNFIPYISTVYLSDKSKTGTGHIPLGDGELKLPSLLKKFKQFEYAGFFSIKLCLSKSELADMDKIEIILKKCRIYYKEYFQDLKLD